MEKKDQGRWSKHIERCYKEEDEEMLLDQREGFELIRLYLLGRRRVARRVARNPKTFVSGMAVGYNCSSNSINVGCVGKGDDTKNQHHVMS